MNPISRLATDFPFNEKIHFSVIKHEMIENLSSISREDLEAEVKRLRKREEFSNAAQEIANSGSCDWDYTKDTIISCTPSYARIFGMSVEEVLERQNSRQKFFEQVHPDDHSIFGTSDQSRKFAGKHDLKYRIYRKDGTIRFIREIALFTEDNESSNQAIILVQDITEQVSMRKEIEESAAKLKLAARTAKLGYWHYDELNNKYLDISEEYAEIHGYGVDEFLKRYRFLDDDLEQVHPDDHAALVEAYDDADGRVDFDYRLQHKDGHWVHVREISTDIQDADGNYIESIGTLQDISALKEAQFTAERASRAKTEFLSRMSHELRTPLNAILGFSQLLEYDGSLDTHQKSNTSAIFKAGQHLLNLINEILDLSRLEAGVTEVSLEPLLLNAMIEECITFVNDMARSRGVTIDRDLTECSGIMVEADATRLKQVFLNLFSNAVKYNRKNGNIRITFVAGESGYINVSIADTGNGIAPDRLGELFEPFNRLGAEFGEVEGTGIGLVITKQLVELMHGKIKVDSNPGAGTIFTLSLKLSEAVSTIAGERQKPDSIIQQVSPADITGPRILVAEDNLLNQALVTAQLDLLGVKADFASNGAEALKLWRSRDYPLLLTDIRMPEMDGIELISQIRNEESDSHRPIIATTASTTDEDVLKCLDSGADDILSKPVNLEDLKQAIDKWLPSQVTETL